MFEVKDGLFDFGVVVLLEVFAALADGLADVFEAGNDVFCDFEFEAVDVFVVDVLDGLPHELLVHALAQQRTGLQDKSHFLLSQELPRRVVLLQQELPRQEHLVVLVQLTRNLLRRQRLQLMG